VEFCRNRGIAGATVFRGILGYGKSSVLHKASLFKLSSDLPIVVEIIDCQEKIDQVLPEIAQMVKDGLITMEKVKVIRA
jgi:PII-like signaling protein